MYVRWTSNTIPHITDTFVFSFKARYLGLLAIVVPCELTTCNLPWSNRNLSTYVFSWSRLKFEAGLTRVWFDDCFAICRSSHHSRIRNGTNHHNGHCNRLPDDSLSTLVLDENQYVERVIAATSEPSLERNDIDLRLMRPCRLDVFTWETSIFNRVPRPKTRTAYLAWYILRLFVNFWRADCYLRVGMQYGVFRTCQFVTALYVTRARSFTRKSPSRSSFIPPIICSWRREDVGDQRLTIFVSRK